MEVEVRVTRVFKCPLGTEKEKQGLPQQSSG